MALKCCITSTSVVHRNTKSNQTNCPPTFACQMLHLYLLLIAVGIYNNKKSICPDIIIIRVIAVKYARHRCYAISKM